MQDMGYRNDVRINTTPEGYGALREAYKEKYDEITTDDTVEMWPTPEDMGNPEFIDRTDTSVIFGWDSAKWAEGALDAASGSPQMLGTHTLEGQIFLLGEQGYPYEVLRIGDEIGDVEQLEYGPCDKLTRRIGATTEIEIWDAYILPEEAPVTNWDKYFSTIEKAAEMQIEWGFAGQLGEERDGFLVKRFDIDEMDEPQKIAFIPAEAEDPGALYAWMISPAN